MGYFPAREAQTTLACPECGAKLAIHRLCSHVEMRCPACNKKWPLKDFITRADKAMEEFLENVYIDRL